MVDATLVFPSGNADSPATDPCRADLTAQLLVYDMRPHEKNIVRRVGGSESTHVTQHATSFHISGLSSYQDVLAWQLGALVIGGTYREHMISAPTFSTDRPLLQSTQRDRRRRSALSSMFDQTRRCADLIKAARGVDPLMLEAFRDAHYQPKHATLVLTGAWTPAALETMRRNYSSFKMAEMPPTPTTEKSKPAATRLVLVIERETQGRVVLSFPMSDAPSERAAQLVLAEIIHARLGKLRTEQAAAYSSRAYLADEYNDNSLVITSDFDPTRGPVIMRTLRTELEKLTAGGFEEAFARARQKVLNTLVADVRDHARLGARLTWLARHQQPLAAVTSIVKEVAELTPDTLRSIAARDLRLDAAGVLIEAQKDDALAAIAPFGGDPKLF